MNGFEAYSPLKWLDGVMAVPFAASVKTAREVFRHGRWVAKGAVAAAAMAIGSIATAGVELGLPSATVERLVTSSGSVAERLAPPGYLSALERAIAATQRLPVQAIDADPPFLV